jgi:hypothetical protein
LRQPLFFVVVVSLNQDTKYSKNRADNSNLCAFISGIHFAWLLKFCCNFVFQRNELL